MKTLLIRLSHKIPAFHLQPHQVEMLRRAVGDRYDIIVTTENQQFLGRLPEADVAVCWGFRAAWYARAPKLKMVHTPAAGHDWVEPDPDGRVDRRYGTFHGRLMRESLVAMMLHFTRRIDLTMADQMSKTWIRERYASLPTLSGSHVVIVGYGAIGRSCAEVLKPFGCRITGVKRDAKADPGSADELRSFKDLLEILPTADHVVCILPGGHETDRLLSHAHFKVMKPGAYLYNLGRGNCYAETELVKALNNGTLAGAGLDVFDSEPLPEHSPLWALENVLVTPHTSAICKDYLTAYLEELIPLLD